MSFEELDLGSREKSQDSIELTPALGIERGEPSESETNIDQVVVTGEPHSDAEMLEADPKESYSQRERSSNFDMQIMMNFMQQMFQQQEEKSEQRLKKLKGQEKSEQRLKELKEGQNEVNLNC
jgi:hypothetical protein